MSKIIVITGASRGFGKIWAEAFLKRGDRVAATARDLNSLSELKAQYGDLVFPVQLDVHERESVFAAIEKINKHFGRIDVLINNAGYVLQGAVEETSQEQARAQFETNFFGLLWVTQAVLPLMRAQAAGHIIQVSSFLGQVTIPSMGLYNASKFAVEGLSETLSSEVKSFGINITLVEPNGYSTELWGGPSYASTTPIEVYNGMREALSASVKPEYFGLAEATVPAIIKLVDAEKPPLRLFMGKIALDAVKKAYQSRISEWESWQDVAVAAHGH